MARILVAEPIAEAGRDVLAAAHEVSVRAGLSREALLSGLAEAGGWDGLVVRSQTRVDTELLQAAAPRLSVIGVASVGTDRIDLAAATRAGVMVVNAPTGNTIAAAEHTMAVMLALLRHVPAADASVRAGEWERGRYTGAELRHKTLGIIGLGKIGSKIAAFGRLLDMRVLACGLTLTPERATAAGATMVPLDTLLRDSDVVSVNLRLSDKTRGFLGARHLALMKPTAFLINSARGPIVDEAALVAALRERRIAGAALDVYDQEPLPAGHPMMALDNAVLTPHSGFVTAETYASFFGGAVDQILAFLDGKTPPRALNPDARRAS
jgi:D-3-phosphoglycerate dehydrogenase / 2-oxoglutarate reductase